MSNENIQRVRIYLSEKDMWETMPLHLAVLELLQREGATGATVLHGVTGFGPGQRSSGSGFVLSDEPPLVIEWVDRGDRIAATLPLLHDMLPSALITIEAVTIYQAIMRAHGPFTGERNVRDMMHTSAQTLASSDMVGHAVALLLTHQQNTMPILNYQQRILGTLNEQDLALRGAMRLPLALLRLLTEDELSEVLAPLRNTSLADVMSTDPRSIYEGASLPQALVTMIEWNYEEVPVVNRDGAFVGLLGSNDVLAAAIEQPDTDDDAAVQTMETTTPVRLVMQAMVPTSEQTQPLTTVLHFLLSTTSRYVVVVDEERRVQGSISAASVLRAFSGDDRAAWLELLQSSAAPDDTTAMPGAAYTVADVLEHDILTLSPDTSIIEATRHMLEARAERAPVVETDKKLLGLLGRSGLLRALIQEGQ